MSFCEIVVQEKDASEHHEYEGIPWRQQLIQLSFSKNDRYRLSVEISWCILDRMNLIISSFSLSQLATSNIIDWWLQKLLLQNCPPQTRFPTAVQDHLWGSQLHWRWGGHTDPRLHLGLDLATGCWSKPDSGECTCALKEGLVQFFGGQSLMMFFLLLQLVFANNLFPQHLWTKTTAWKVDGPQINGFIKPTPIRVLTNGTQNPGQHWKSYGNYRATGHLDPNPNVKAVARLPGFQLHWPLKIIHLTIMMLQE